MKHVVEFLAEHAWGTRLVVHILGAYLFYWATGNWPKPRRAAVTKAGRFANHAIWGWFVLFTLCSSTQFYAGSWWFWIPVFVVDYLLVLAAVVIRRLGLLNADLAHKDGPKGRE